jgi:hypothetical protein
MTPTTLTSSIEKISIQILQFKLEIGLLEHRALLVFKNSLNMMMN